jgi:CBS domain-containing protein/ribosome-associated translation inhibitor RaiA
MARKRLRDLKVRDWMSTDLVTATPDEPLSELLGKMASRDVHELPVVQGRRLVGLVTLAAVARRKNLSPSTKAESIMATPPSVDAEDALPTAAEKMLSAGYRAVPVMEGGELVGVVSRTDLVRALADAEDAEGVLAEGVMTPQPQVVREEETIDQAHRIMETLEERSVPVVDRNGRLVGVVGLKDLARYFGRPKAKESTGEVAGERTKVRVQIQSVMTYPPVTVSGDARLKDVVGRMLDHDISSVFVTEGEEPVGVVTKADLMEFVAGVQEREEILVEVSGLHEQEIVFDEMYGRIRRAVRRVSGIVTPRILQIHVVTYREDGDRTKYSLRARLTTDRGVYHLKHYDWDLLAAVDGLMDLFERRIKKEKDRRLAARRRPSRS